MLKIKNLSKKFIDNEVLNGIELNIVPGKFTTLLGKNGSGKSTLLKIISGYELPTSGKVTYKDILLSSLDFPFTNDIFFVHENVDYELPYSIGEFIQLYKERYPKWNDVIFNKMVKDRDIKLDKNFHSYSRGQKMQICLMMAIASNAAVLLLDEITSVIDIYGRKYFLDILRQYVDQGNTVVITTNIINELEFYTDVLVILKDKKIVLNENVNEISIKFTKLRRSHGDNHEIFNNPHCIWAGSNSDRSTSYIIPSIFLQNKQIPDKYIDRRQSSLEDIFIYYFKNDEDEYVNAA